MQWSIPPCQTYHSVEHAEEVADVIVCWEITVTTQRVETLNIVDASYDATITLGFLQKIFFWKPACATAEKDQVNDVLMLHISFMTIPALFQVTDAKYNCMLLLARMAEFIRSGGDLLYFVTGLQVLSRCTCDSVKFTCFIKSIFCLFFKFTTAVAQPLVDYHFLFLFVSSVNAFVKVVHSQGARKI